MRAKLPNDATANDSIVRVHRFEMVDDEYVRVRTAYLGADGLHCEKRRHRAPSCLLVLDISAWMNIIRLDGLRNFVATPTPFLAL